MALFCTEYLLSTPFHFLLQIDKQKEHIRAGYYAFQDYAVSHWYDHMTSSFKTSPEVSTDIRKQITTQLKLFLEHYGIPEKREFGIRDGEFINIAEMLRCIPQDVRDWSQWFDLEWRTSCIRSVIESLGDEESLDDANRDLKKQIYGTQLFKCSRIECNHFTTGFDSRNLRDEHLNRHNRPFICVEQHCPFQALGFETEAQLESHLARNHAGDDADKFLFPQPPRRKDDTIHKASARGDIVAVRSFLDSGVNPNTTSRLQGGETPLFLATRNSHLKICKMLVESGAEVNFKGPRGSNQSTVLHAAVSRGDAEMVHYFLSLSNILPDQLNKDSQTPLQIAVETKSEAVLQLLLATSKVNTDIRDKYGRTALSRAAEVGAETVVKMFLATGKVDPDAKDQDGRTPLSWAAKKGGEAVIALLLATGKVDPHTEDSGGRTPLGRAAGEGAEVVVKMLLAGKVDPDSKDRYGQTPLSIAAENGRETVVEVLLATSKVDPDAKDQFGRTPLSFAAENGGEPMIALLPAVGKVDPDRKDDEGRTPPSRGAEKGAEAVIKMLLATGKVDPDARNNRGLTPRDMATEAMRRLNGYQKQLLLLEQQNKKRLMMARREQDNISRDLSMPGQPGMLPPRMSPSGSRTGASPNPSEQMKRARPRSPAPMNFIANEK